MSKKTFYYWLYNVLGLASVIMVLLLTFGGCIGGSHV